MSLYQCEKCWDCPCTCGWQYREHLEKLADRLLNLKRYSTGTADEGGGYTYEYTNESPEGRWVDWDDIQAIADGLKKGSWE